jgi:hypothetical protein
MDAGFDVGCYEWFSLFFPPFSTSGLCFARVRGCLWLDAGCYGVYWFLLSYGVQCVVSAVITKLLFVSSSTCSCCAMY